MYELKSTNHPNRLVYTISIISVFALYIILRLVTWGNASLIEDHDSISYLEHAKLFVGLDWQDLGAIDPTATPFYPFFTAIFSNLTGSVELGARVCSLFFSSLLFFAIYAIGRRFAEPYAVVIGLILLATNASLVRLSYSILSEPAYIALVYIGYWIFLVQYKNPKYNFAVFLGIIYGLSFLDRFEGILYLAGIPALQFLHFIIFRKKNYDWKRLTVWSAVFVLSFIIVVAPQVWSVSSKMDSFSLNGRQAWSVILKAPDGRTNTEKIYGLNYSPSQANLPYLMEHPLELQKLASMSGSLISRINDYARLAIKNFNELYTKQLGILIGPLGLVLFGFGLMSLFLAGYRYEAGFVLAVIFIGLIGPLLHNVVIRHIAMIAPIMLLLEGIGVIYISRTLATVTTRSRIFTKRSLSVAITALMVGLSSYGILQHNLRPDADIYSHRPGDFEKPLRIVREVQKQLGRPVIVSARKLFFSYYAGGITTWLPYTDSEGLMRFYRLNDPPDFVFLEYRHLRYDPFLDDFAQGVPDELELLYRGTDTWGGKIELYRYRG